MWVCVFWFFGEGCSFVVVFLFVLKIFVSVL